MATRVIVATRVRVGGVKLRRVLFCSERSLLPQSGDELDDDVHKRYI